MGANSNIAWTDHTFNPWIGCTKVSPGCANCYAETLMDTRYGRVKWGKGQSRHRTSESNWNQPLKWHANVARVESEAYQNDAAIPRRPRVFCASLADWLDDEVPIEWLADLLILIDRCRNLDWLMLTKRPENWCLRISQANALLGDRGAQGDSDATSAFIMTDEWLTGHVPAPANVWIGATVEDQQRADERIPELLQIPARARFLSCEPLLGPVNVTPFFHNGSEPFNGSVRSWKRDGIHWVICGGESGPKARPMHPDWARSLRDQCAAAGVPFFFKQWGEWMPRSQLFLRCNEPAAVQLAKHLKMQSAVMRRDSGIDASLGDACTSNDADSAIYRVGTKAAGHLLDGKEHHAFPEVLP